MIVCICQNISDRKIREEVEAGARNLAHLRSHLGVGTCCGKCHVHAKQVLRECLDHACTMARDPVQPLVFQPTPLAA